MVVLGRRSANAVHVGRAGVKLALLPAVADIAHAVEETPVAPVHVDVEFRRPLGEAPAASQLVLLPKQLQVLLLEACSGEVHRQIEAGEGPLVQDVDIEALGALDADVQQGCVHIGQKAIRIARRDAVAERVAEAGGVEALRQHVAYSWAGNRVFEFDFEEVQCQGSAQPFGRENQAGGPGIRRLRL